jgi:hypothetical protein
MTETTVEVPAEHPARAAADTTAEPAATAAPSGTSSPSPAPPSPVPPAPERAQVRLPLSLDFRLLPPQLQVRLLDELSFTATVTQARLAWERDRLRLGLGYSYGGALTTDARLRTGIGTFSGEAGFDPGTSVGSLSAGYTYGDWRARLSGDTGGGFSGRLSFGAELPPTPDELTGSVMRGEAGARGLLAATPGVLSNPASLPGVISAHGEDISAVSGAARTLGRVIDLRDRDTRRINWGFYLSVARRPDSAVTVSAGVGGTF